MFSACLSSHTEYFTVSQAEFFFQKREHLYLDCNQDRPVNHDHDTYGAFTHFLRCTRRS